MARLELAQTAHDNAGRESHSLQTLSLLFNTYFSEMAAQRFRRAPQNPSLKTPRPILYQEPSGRHLSRRYESSMRREGDIRKSNADIQDFQDSTFISHSALIPGQQLKGTPDEGPSSESPVPAFFPDTSGHSTEGFGPLSRPTENVLPSSLLSHFQATSHSSVPSPTFSPLPPLLSVISSSSMSAMDSSVSIPSPPTEDLPTANALDTSTPHRALLQNKLATPVIILLAVATGCLFLGACIITKSCTARSRRRRLKPLLPVLEKAYPDEDDFECKGSSIFGGKEQFSPAPGRTSTEWSWVQYPIPSSQPSAQATIHDARNQGNYEQAFTNSVPRDPAAQYPFSSTGCTHQFPTDPEPMAQESQHAVTRSTESEPMVTVAKHSAQTPVGTGGLPLDAAVQGPVSTTDSQDVIERMRRSNSQNHEQKRRSSGVGSIIAYDGADVSSPIFEATFQPLATPVLSAMPVVAQEGRARVQSSYFVNRPFTRFSVLPETYAIGTATKVNLTHAHAHSIENEVNLTTQMSDDQRERQTEALTHALGLPSPRCEYVVCSPQPSLYPDDSTPHTRDSSGPSSRSIVTMESGSSLLGSSNQSFDTLEKLSGVLENEGTRKTKRLKKKTGRRDSDKPPRVPSPPPLPSLTQMGLEHANPEAYSNYRSPTYSIYGLYDGERKSGIGY